MSIVLTEIRGEQKLAKREFKQTTIKIFRQIAESGRTVILTTHAMENVRLFDRVVVLLRGKLIFYGTPTEALEFVGANNFVDLYNKLDTPKT